MFHIIVNGTEILGLLRDDYTDIPAGAIPITDAEGALLCKCSNFSHYFYSGSAVIDSGVRAAEHQVALADADALVQAKGDATIQYLVHHTPAEIDAKVRQLVNANGVTNLATAVTSLKAVEDLLVRIAIALSVAAKDRLR